MIWQVSISSPDRERAFQALEVAALFALGAARCVNGSVWIERSPELSGSAALVLHGRALAGRVKKHYARLSLPKQGCPLS